MNIRRIVLDPGENRLGQHARCKRGSGLTGVTEARASVIIDGRAKTTTVFLQPRTARQETSQYGPGMNPGADAAKALGVQAALDRAEFTAAITTLASARRTIYTPFAAEVLGSQGQGDPTRLWANNAKDPWDGRDAGVRAYFVSDIERLMREPGLSATLKRD